MYSIKKIVTVAVIAGMAVPTLAQAGESRASGAMASVGAVHSMQAAKAVKRKVAPIGGYASSDVSGSTVLGFGAGLAVGAGICLAAGCGKGSTSPGG